MSRTASSNKFRYSSDWQILSQMQAWKHESLFAEYIADEDLVASSFRTHRRRPSVNPSERSVILRNTVQALQQLQMSLIGQENEQQQVTDLLKYVQCLQALNPAQTADEQFSHLYQLRKRLFWVPVFLLQSQSRQGSATLTIAHFYATALALEPLFPDLGSSFCSAMALPPLDAIISVTNAMQSEHAMDPMSIEVASLMQFPQQTALNYRIRAMQTQQTAMRQDPPTVNINPETLSYTSVGNLSPAFAPSPLHYGTPQSSSSGHSPWLEVPTTHSGFSYGTQSWGVPSPGLSPQGYSPQIEQMYGYMSMGSGFRSGFVPSAPIWT